MNKCYVANFFSILYAKYCRIRSIFVETTVEQKRRTFLDHRVKLTFDGDFEWVCLDWSHSFQSTIARNFKHGTLLDYDRGLIPIIFASWGIQKYVVVPDPQNST